MKNPKLPFDMDIIINNFALETGKTSELMTKWFSSSFKISEHDLKRLEKIRNQYFEEGDYWNEEELKVRFIAQIMEISEMEEKGKIKAFLERNIKTNTENYEINVNVDLMLATPLGKNSPQRPYFFLQELKKGKKSGNDPEAQMLAAMLASQILNNDGKSVFGCYEVGRNWYFTTLEDNKYILSRQFDATNHSDLIQIVNILHNIKSLI
jgi:hypothetical protein